MTPSSIASRLLYAVLPRDEANAVLGDLNEELHRRAAAGHGWARRRMWLEMQAWRYGLAVTPAAIGRGLRTAGHILRDAVRGLRAAPATIVTVLAILTISIAAATVTFSIVDTVVLRPLPFDDDHELVVVESRDPRWTSVRPASPAHYLTLSDRLTTVRPIAAVTYGRVVQQTIATGGPPEAVVTAEVTASLFDVLRVRPIIGQVFSAVNETDGNQGVAVISHGLWQRLFGGDVGAVGQRVQLVGTSILGGRRLTSSLTVIGVMPRGFAYPLAKDPPADVWTPYVMTTEERARVGGGHYLHILGRLQPGASLSHAQAEVDAAATALATALPDGSSARGLAVLSLKDTLLDPNVSGWMLLLLAAVGLVMLVACANVANLQLARAVKRARELSIRASLGATRRQLALTLLVESLLLSLVAAGGAIALSAYGIQTARASLPPSLLRVSDIDLDVRVLASAITAAVATGLLFGVIPAWQASRANLVGVMKGTPPATGLGPTRWRTIFVVAEIAFVSVLLVSSTLIISSFIRVTTADLGFDRSDLFEVRGPALSGSGRAETMAQLRAVPGVAAVAAVGSSSPPLVAAGFTGGGASLTEIRAAGAGDQAKPVRVEYRRVSSSYFETIRNPVVRGHVFDDSDAAGETAVVIDERAAEMLFGDTEAVGGQLVGPDRAGGGAFGRRTVTAVVRHVRTSGPEQASRPQIYLPATGTSGVTFLVRAGRSSNAMATIEASFRAGVPAGPGAPVEVRRLEDAFRNITADRRFNATVMSMFGALAVVVGALGVYGVIASVVAQQTRELGIRVALGATTGRIVRDVLAQAGRFVAVGLVFGLPAGWLASRSIASLLFEVRQTDLVTYGIVAGALTATALLAAWIPARRAARVDPLISLRSE